MEWFVERGGEVAGPVSTAQVSEWTHAGYLSGARIRHVDWAAMVPIEQTPFAQSMPRPQPRSSGCTPIAIIALALVVLAGGCTIIVSEPVVALAVVFVGVPFVTLVLWAAGVLLAGPRQA